MSKDRNNKPTYKLWETSSIIRDYWSKPKKTDDPQELHQEDREH